MPGGACPLVSLALQLDRPQASSLRVSGPQPSQTPGALPHLSRPYLCPSGPQPCFPSSSCFPSVSSLAFWAMVALLSKGLQNLSPFISHRLAPKLPPSLLMTVRCLDVARAPMVLSAPALAPTPSWCSLTLPAQPPASLTPPHTAQVRSAAAPCSCCPLPEGPSPRRSEAAFPGLAPCPTHLTGAAPPRHCLPHLFFLLGTHRSLVSDLAQHLLLTPETGPSCGRYPLGCPSLLQQCFFLLRMYLFLLHFDYHWLS